VLAITHGVLSNKNDSLISHALFEGEEAYCAYLDARPSRFVSLEEALYGRGDALTVDDATFAGFRAVVLALQAGHAVTWCVNGEEVEENLSYFPFQISSMLDRTRQQRCVFEGTTWDLSTSEKLRAFRLSLKQRYMQLDTRPAIDSLVASLSDTLDVDACLGEQLQTVGRREISVAASLGCRLLNHGWTHLNPNAVTERELAVDIARNADWVRSFQNHDLNLYVPPYGRMVHHARAMGIAMLLADRARSCADDPLAFNRQDLDCNCHQVERFVKKALEVAA
jgi:hypothetical protein